MIPYRIQKAIELYKNNKINKILVSGDIGYFNKNKKISEARIMYSYLLKNNIPKQDIFIENKSKNTIDNTLYSINLIKTKYNQKRIKLLLISSDYHTKRCKLLSLKNNYLYNIFTINAINTNINKNNWYKTIKGKITIKKEALLLSYYAKKNLIIDQEINI